MKKGSFELKLYENEEKVQNFLKGNYETFELYSQLNAKHIYKTEEGIIGFYSSRYGKEIGNYFFTLVFSKWRKKEKEIVNKVKELLIKNNQKGILLIEFYTASNEDLTEEMKKIEENIFALDEKGEEFKQLIEILKENGFIIERRRDRFLLEMKYDNTHIFSPIYPKHEQLTFSFDETVNKDNVTEFIKKTKAESIQIKVLKELLVLKLKEEIPNFKQVENENKINVFGRKLKFQLIKINGTNECILDGKSASNDFDIFSEKTKIRVTKFIEKNRLRHVFKKKLRKS